MHRVLIDIVTLAITFGAIAAFTGVMVIVGDRSN